MAKIVFGIKPIIRLFDKHNMCVVGEKGSGKDLIFGNVIARKKKKYVSNLNYGYDYNELNFHDICMSDNKYKNLIDKNVKKYIFPFPDGTDVYLSDAGVYLPSQYNNELNRDYQGISMYQALCRQLGDNRFHFNCQALGRVWDKIREHCTRYILCRKTIYIKGINVCITHITLYDTYEACRQRIHPCRVRVPLLNPQARATAQTYLDNFYNQNGEVEDIYLIYHNKSKHNTRYFKEVFENGV